jgi:signal transduction histidine kinase
MAGTRRRAFRLFASTNLFNKLLGFLLLCLVCSGGLAAWLITRHMTHLVYTQTQVVFEGDVRNLNAFLQQEQQRLLADATNLAHDDSLLVAVALDVVEEVQNITRDYQTLLEVHEVIVTNPQGQIISRGYDVHDRLDARLLGTAFGAIAMAGQYYMFAQVPLPASEGHSPGHVVVLQTLSNNRAFFQALRTAIGKDAILFAGKHEVGSTFAASPGQLQPTPVAAGLFTAFNRRFIGTEQKVDGIVGDVEWRVVLLQSAAPLVQAIRWVHWGTVIFTVAFIGLITVILGLFFAAHIRRPMTLIQQGLAAITQGRLTTRLDLGRRDEWRRIEQALNQMTASLMQHEAALQRKVVEATTLYEVGQEIAAQVDLDALLRLIVERARMLLEAQVSLLALRQEGSDTFRMRAHSGKVPETLASLHLRPGEGLGGRVVATGMPVVVNDYIEEFGDSPFLTAVGEAGVRAAVAVPLKTRDLVIGVLYVHSSTSHQFQADDAQLLSALADQTAIAIDKTTLYQQVREHAAELEVRVAERTHQLQEKNTELEETLLKLQEMQNQIILQEKMASLGSLTAGIAHEIKNPLNFVNNFAELSTELIQELRDDLDKHQDVFEPEAFENIEELLQDLELNLQKIHEHGKRADSIAHNMLLHSRGTAGQRESIDINAFVAESVNLAYHGLRAKDTSFNITIETDYDPSVGALDIVPQDMSRVFLNVINNACYAAHVKRQALGEGFTPTLSICTKDLGDCIAVAIRDNGNGVPVEMQDKIFQPFFTTKPTGVGTGLGLSLSYDIVTQEHHGELSFNTEIGQYTEFVITLPRQDTSVRT